VLLSGDSSEVVKNLAHTIGVDEAAGRVRSSVVVGLHAAGFGVIDCVDPQKIEAEQIGPFFHTRKFDIGTPKAVTLARFLNRRELGVVNGVYGDVEGTSLDRVRQASLVISCTNRIPARIGRRGRHFRRTYRSYKLPRLTAENSSAA
jgi:molybdopterin/thiamine biosynthesis adenylyltransferase